MHGAAVTFARMVRESGKTYDLIIATDLMDVAVFRALLGAGQPPVVTYFHENQICYPISPDDTDLSAGRDLHYGFINYTTALASDRIFFNSDYHREAFLGALPGFLDRYPDHQNRETIDQIAAKAATLPLGLDLAAFDQFRPHEPMPAERPPLLLWNHRWEYDKDPEAFFELLYGLEDRSIEFEVVLLGERGRSEPAVLVEARQRLGERIVHNGPVTDFGEYASWLWRADILPVTSNQDFFGGSVVEALYCGCHPILPRRLAYPEHLDDPAAFYDSPGESLDKLARLIRSGEWREPYRGRETVRCYDWLNCCQAYDTAFLPA
jgi:glycosyltransferase involved in cell wall biosynthesis